MFLFPTWWQALHLSSPTHSIWFLMTVGLGGGTRTSVSLERMPVATLVCGVTVIGNASLGGTCISEYQ